MGLWIKGSAGHSEARILSEYSVLSKDSQSLRLGIEFKLEKDWHLYWKNPGEVGFPPRLQWNLPSSWKANEIQFPVPLKIEGEQKSISYGYRDRVLYPVTLSRLSEHQGDQITLKIHLQYLICAIQCVPETLDLELDLKLGSPQLSTEAKRLQQAFDKLPRPAPPKAGRISAVSDKSLILDLSDFNDRPIEDVFIAPLAGKSKWTTIPLEQNQWKLTSSELIQAFEWTATWKVNGELTAVYGTWEEISSPKSEAGFRGFAIALLLALIGGFLLNLMPCVLPVVFLKTFSLIEARREHRKSLIFTIAGIWTSFLIIALATILLKSAGREMGWGFQFQSPGFIVGMTFLIFLFALNLFDLFHFQLPGSASSKLARADAPFLEGVFATLLATPCSAPFLGSALTFAIAQPPHLLVAFYLVMGIGLSIPYLCLLVAPSLLKILPKPGAWMDRFKNVLGYSLIASCLWLLSVLQQLSGTAAVYWLLGGCLGVFVLLKEFKSLARWLGIALFIFGSSWMAVNVPNSKADIEAVAKFSASELEGRVAKGDRLFVIITADWCLTCKYNERVVTDTSWFKEQVRTRNIELVTFDWTQPNEAIAVFLKKNGRVGIPFSMLIKKDKSIVLPELLSRSIVENALGEFDR